MRTAVITGASGGIGSAAAKKFAAEGWRVYGLCRRAGDTPGVSYIGTDVTDEASVRAAFARIGAEAGWVDVLVNNAGFGISGAAEFTELADAKRQFDVNFFGGFTCAKAAAPLMRERGGRIVNVSSAAAIFSIPFQAFYSASKAAINSLTLALRNELRPFGISVCALMPGDVKTGFTAARQKSAAGSELYGASIEKSVATMEKDETGGMSPDYIAGKIYAAAVKRRVKPLAAIGGKYKIFAMIGKLMPASFVNWAVGKLYIRR